MKSPLLLFGAVLLVAPVAKAATPVQGVLPGSVSWDAAGSPYRFQGRVVVPPGATLVLSPGARLEFGPSAGLHVRGSLRVEGRAANPVVLDFRSGGDLAFLLVEDGNAEIRNAKFLGGRWVFSGARLTVEGSEFTRGSGLYLAGSTDARITSNKMYGNSTGAALDGSAVRAQFRFNTLVGNTHGLHLKGGAIPDFRNNSVRDNQVEVFVEGGGAVDLSGNAWGGLSEAQVLKKCRGRVTVAPMRPLKEILRAFVRERLPEIPGDAARELARKEREAEKRKKTLAAAKPAPPEVPKEAVEPKADGVSGAPGLIHQAGSLKPLPPAPRVLKPLIGLPPAQPLPGEIPATSRVPSGAEAAVPPPAAEPPKEKTPQPVGVGGLDLPPPDFGGFEEGGGEAAAGTSAPAPSDSELLPPLEDLDTGLPPAGPQAAKTPEAGKESAPPPADTGALDLPLLGEDVPPPSDLDLPPVDDLGDLQLDL